jgi:hypothetical protein
MATKSPAYALFFGQQVLARAVNDADLTGNTVTISVTFDAFASEAAQDGTVVAKHHGTTSGRQGWLINYTASTRRAALRVHDAAGNWVQRETTSALPIRANVTFVFNAGSIDAYVNGVLANGSLTNSGTVTTMNATLEPLSFACHSTSTTPANPWKGAIHFFAMWNTARSAANIGTMLPNGVIGSAFLLADSDLRIYYRDQDMTGSNNNDFVSWVDQKQSRALSHIQISGVRLVKVQPPAGVILTTRLWDANLTDQALYATGLTTTYTLSTPYRLWGAALSEPQISSNFSSTNNDFTLILKVRKVTGRTSAVLFRKRGVNVQFTLANKELFVILGDDTSATLQNKRISFGLNLFPIEGVDAALVFRYNAVERDMDLFINQIGYTGTESQTSTNANETTTGLFLSESCDFISAAYTPACLSDAQVDAFVVGTSQLVYGAFASPTQGSLGITSTHHPDNVVVGADRAAPAQYVDPPLDSIPHAPTFIESFDAFNQIAPGVRIGSYDIFDSKPLVDDPAFINPLPEVISVQLSGGSITAQGRAGPTDAYLCRTWWEIELVANQLQALGASTYPRDLFTQRLTFTDTFAVPPDVNLAGRAAVLVVQPQKNSKQTFRSTPYLIDVVAPTDPVPVITSAVIGADGTTNASVNVGATNAGPCTTWFEVESAVGSNTYSRISALYTNQNFGSASTVNATFSLGIPTGWAGRRLRYVINPDGAATVFFRSAGFVLADFSYTNPNPAISSVTISAYRVASVQGTTGISNMGLATVWWELEVTTGEFIAVIDRRTNVDTSAPQTIVDTFTIPGNFSLAGKQLRLAVQAAAGATPFYSAPTALANPSITSPNPTVTAASCSLTKLLTASATLGTSNLINARLWWEVEYTAGQFTAVFGTVSLISLATSSAPSLSLQLPNRFDLTGKSIRLAIQSTDDPTVTWQSAPFTVNQVQPATPTLTISASTVNVLNAVTITGSIGATNLGQVTAWYEFQVESGAFQVIANSQSALTLSGVSSTAFNFSRLFDNGPQFANTTVRLAVRSNTFPELVYYSAPSAIADPGSASAPNPTVTTATEDPNGTLVLAGTAGPSDIGLVDYWYEIQLVTGQLLGQFFKTTNVNISTLQTFSASLVLPNRLTTGTKTVTLVVTPAGKPQTRYTSTPAVINATPYTSPAPVCTFFTVSPRFVATASGTLSASNIGNAHYWWEIEDATGKFVAIVEKTLITDTASGSTRTLNLQLVGKPPVAGRNARLAVAPVARPDTIYYSTSVAITAQAFVGTLTVTASTYTINSALTATASVSNGNNLGSGTEWWEVSMGGQFIAQLAQQAVTLNTNFQTRTLNVTLPDRFDLQGKTIRYAFSPAGYPETVSYSPAYAITVELIADPVPLIQSLSADTWARITASVRAGPTNAAFCRVWWEIGTTEEFTALFDTKQNVNLFSQQTIADTFTLARRSADEIYSYAGKSVRFAVQTNIRPENIYYSPAVLLNIPAMIDPFPLAVSAEASAGVATFQGSAGPTNIGPCYWWWEIATDGSGWYRYENGGAIADFTLQTGVTASYAVPTNVDFRGARARLAVAPVADRDIEYRSNELVLNGEGWFNVNCGENNTRVPYLIRTGRVQPKLQLQNTRATVTTVGWTYNDREELRALDGYGVLQVPPGTFPEELNAGTLQAIADGWLILEPWSTAATQAQIYTQASATPASLASPKPILELPASTTYVVPTAVKPVLEATEPPIVSMPIGVEPAIPESYPGGAAPEPSAYEPLTTRQGAQQAIPEAYPGGVAPDEAKYAPLTAAAKELVVAKAPEAAETATEAPAAFAPLTKPVTTVVVAAAAAVETAPAESAKPSAFAPLTKPVTTVVVAAAVETAPAESAKPSAFAPLVKQTSVVAIKDAAEAEQIVVAATEAAAPVAVKLEASTTYVVPSVEAAKPVATEVAPTFVNQVRKLLWRNKTATRQTLTWDGGIFRLEIPAGESRLQPADIPQTAVLDADARAKIAAGEVVPPNWLVL